MPSPLRVAVLGAGAFGRNHVRIYRELAVTGHAHLSAVVDASPEALAAACSAGPVAAFSSTEQLLDALASGRLHLDAASVCLPTAVHAETAIALLRAGVHVLVEKPIAATLAEAEAMTEAATQAGRVLQVGHLERFNPAVAAAFAALNAPMFFEVHRLSVFTPRSLDVDVVLDLMIHDLDIVLRMAASPLTEIRAVGLPILSPKTDIANVRLEFASGCVANLTASRVSTEQVRKLRFFQPSQYISVDYARQEAFAIDVRTGGPQTGSAQPNLGFRPFAIQRAEPLRLELESFLNSASTGTEPAVTPAEATAALKAALEISTLIQAHSKRTGLA